MAARASRPDRSARRASAACLYLRGSTGGANASLFGSTYELYNASTGKELVNGAAIFTKTGGTGAAATGATGGAGASPTPYFISYTSNIIGIDSRSNVTATFVDGSLSSALTSYYASYQEALGNGTNTATMAYGDGTISIGRWAGGTTNGVYYSSGTIAIPANGGFEYAIGNQATNLPTTGTLSYNLLGATPVTLTDGSGTPGIVDSAHFNVNFGTTTKIGLDLAITMPGDATYSFATTGGIADPSLSQISVVQPNNYTGLTRFGLTGGAVTGTGASCATAPNCKLSIQGFFAGDRVQRAGYVFTLGDSTLTNKTLHGALAFGNDAGATVPALAAAPLPENTGAIGAPFVSGGSRTVSFVKDGVTKLTNATSNISIGGDSDTKVTQIIVNPSIANLVRGSAVTGEAYGTANVQIGPVERRHDDRG